ncbi:MAG TPA: RNA polymerase subunit sigma-70 [Ruminococcaceae bacterium]|nr:RNA polymerase subunit sigma-70 [Oscillospiraceae bacterium]
MAIAAVKKIIESDLFTEIKQDLIDQLDRNCTVGKYYTDLIDDYMDLWVTKNLLISDIQKRGAVVTYNNGGGQKGRKKNDSIDQLIKVNAQMLKLLSEIGIKPTQTDGEVDDEM